MDEKTLNNYIKAGKIAAECREYGRGFVKIRASLKDVTEAIEKKLFDLGGKPAFPVQLSLNKDAAHNCAAFDDVYVFSENDMVKIDVGVEIEGCIGDTACTVYLGNDERMKLLVRASEEALAAALLVIKPGVKLSEIGAAIEKEITKYRDEGFNPIRNLSGHGLGIYDIHAAPQIPNFDNHDKTVLKEDDVIAIEPFATTGIGIVGQGSAAEVMQMVNPKPVRSPITREVMKVIQEYKEQPFCKRWLINKFGPVRTNFALREMISGGMLQEYPPLPEVTGRPVSQAEHTIIVRDVSIVTTKI